MNIYHAIDDDITINGQTYTVDASFNNILLIFDVMNDERIREKERLNLLLKLLIGDELKDLSLEEQSNAIESILNKYISLEDENIEYDIQGNPMPKIERENEIYMDYVEDSDLIYSSFYQAYGIDLIDMQGKLHWLKFKALLNGLPPKSRLMDVIGIRAWTPNESKKSYKQQMAELQRKYRLKGGKHEQDRW